ncbi:dTDP-4-dehydrorhamnose reductase [Sphingomonas sp. LY160]|uniref:dTDP-4-dehydrorhamnose reductase n=1 Tax=Sphingomonas sp. LY160 TaxID=3095342 RepID=UPI002ADECBA6|nr:dTDP-4-dehydrorhamnose reductase [Sphingomonas sp. LY160]MEA1072012.1 dTDP-4-dehydrorhamnose reductase [Sphingomonas sp. LY160]
MRMLVTGREGQVVRSLVECGEASGVEVVALGRPELDLSTPAEDILAAIAAAHPDVIVSAAAYTAVDKAESDEEAAFAINARGAGAVAKAAATLGVPLIHISTDYVFDGRKDEPYREDDPTGPTGVYGSSKLAGEQAVLAAHDDVAILRTAWVYSPFGANFVKTMLRLGQSHDEVRVVADQIGNPTSALDIAAGIIAVARNLVADRDAKLRGVFHMTAAGEASWAEFADAVFAAASAQGAPSATVVPITTADYPVAATRPPNSRLNCEKLAAAHGVSLPDWHGSAALVVERLLHAPS